LKRYRCFPIAACVNCRNTAISCGSQARGWGGRVVCVAKGVAGAPGLAAFPTDWKTAGITGRHFLPLRSDI